MNCIKCGCELDGNAPICMNCGTAVPEESISKETKERLEKESKTASKTSGPSNARVLGAILLIFGIMLDIISMIFIFTLDVGGFSFVTVLGTILFFVGIALFANG